MGILFVVVTLTLAPQVSWLLFDLQQPIYAYLTLVCIIAAVLTRYCSLILRMQEKGLAYSASQILPKLIFLGLVFIFAWLLQQRHFDDLLYAHVISIVAVLLFFAWNTRQFWQGIYQSRCDYQQIKTALQFGFPLMVGGFAIWGLNSIDRFFLRTYADLQALGLYSVSLSFANAATIVTSIFTTLWSPTIFKILAKDPNDVDFFHQAKDHMLAAVVILASLVGVFSFVVPFFLPKPYAAIAYLLPAVFLIPLLYALSEAFSIGIQVVRKTHVTMWCAFAALCLSAIFNFYFTPRLGAFGAAMAAVLAYNFFVISRICMARRLWQHFPLALLLIYLTTLAALAIVGLVWQSPWLHGMWAILLLIALIQFKSSVGALYHLLAHKKSAQP
jgi:O-antigen/teichoic acid export membrane protein